MEIFEMDAKELHNKIQASKAFLNREMVRLRTTGESAFFTLDEAGSRIDVLHEIERIGLRNIGEREGRKLKRVLVELETRGAISLN